MIPARWAIAARPDASLTTALAADLSIPEALAALLVQRGLAAPALAKAFLRPDLAGLSDPRACAVLDPLRADCPSVEKTLCGAGVAFKLAQALAAELGLSPNLPLHFLDYVALATVADVVPLVGENR